ncbi:MAG: fumarylacetoacetate hydrolase family protein, partial [Actinomycetota bacterium]
MAFTFANHAGRAVLVDGNNFHDLEALSGGTVPSDPAAALAHGDKLHDLQKKTAGRTPEGTIDAAKLGAPSPTPQKVFGIGLNYKTHAAESNMEVPDNPVVFAKFSSCICAPNSNIELRSDRVDYEGEIVVII